MKRTAELTKLGEVEEHTYTVVHAKHGKEEIKASSSYGAAKKYADMKKLKSTAGVDAHLHTKEDSFTKHANFYRKIAMSDSPHDTIDKLLITKGRRRCY